VVAHAPQDEQGIVGPFLQELPVIEIYFFNEPDVCPIVLLAPFRIGEDFVGRKEPAHLFLRCGSCDIRMNLFRPFTESFFNFLIRGFLRNTEDIVIIG